MMPHSPAYTLTLSTGRRIAVAARLLAVGHTEACDVRVPNASPYADEQLAVVRLTPAPSGGPAVWTLVNTAPHHEMRVNGLTVRLACHLADGDRVEWPDQAFAFTFRTGDSGLALTDGQVAAVPRHLGRRIALWATLPTLLLALCLGAAWMLGAFADHTALTPDMQAATRRSVLQVSVDSVYLLRITPADTTVLRAVGQGEGGMTATAGTAFLTTDSLLVTARHCIEPWVGDDEPFSQPDSSRLSFVPSRWALEAETFNQLHGTATADTVLRVVSVCSLWSYEGEQPQRVGTVRSSDFRTEQLRDDIVDLGDFTHERYWRSIKRRHQRTDMMRDDVAVLPWHTAGTIRLATTAQLPALLGEGDPRLEFFGFPSYTDLRLEHTADRLRRPLRRADDDTTLFDMLATGGDLRHGYSGGPVMVRSGNACLCVGLVSVTDARGADRFYAVPVSEVNRLKQRRP